MSLFTGMLSGVGDIFNSASDKISVTAGNIADQAPGALENARNAAVKAGQPALTWADETTDKWFNLGSPDGVQSRLDEQISRMNGNSTLTAYAHFDTFGVSGRNITITADNQTATNGTNIFYTKDIDSYGIPNPDGKPGSSNPVTIGPRPYSLFNKYSLINYKGTPLIEEDGKAASEAASYNRINPTSIQNPTATKIIELTSADKNNIGYRYDYSDFALAEYFGKIPNNQMVTLRRFAFPAPDDIISPKGLEGEDIPQPDIARAITWMGEQTGNSMADILKFSHGFNWKEASAAVQTLNSQKGARSGSFGERINSSKWLSAAAAAGQGKDAYQTATTKANGGFDAFSETYPNHVFGPLNVIKDVLVREQGLTFSQEFTLKFEYKLRELGGANPKILMLDQLSNILALTYNNAPFWGGAVRYIGDGSIARPLGNIKHLREGNYKEFMTSVVDDLAGAATNLMDDVKGLLEGKDSKLLNNMLGGSLMKMFNSPQGGQAVNSLLTGDPTGQWHVTIGNPLNPIIVMGNLACTATDVSFEGNMGPNDFPEKMVVSITLKPGRPRDKAEIESMFNSGRGRFYIQPSDTADINDTRDVSAYGNKDKKRSRPSKYTNTFRGITNG
jgi:hypothetical protein